MPFGDPEKAFSKFKFGIKSRNYGMKMLPFMIIADRYENYLNDNRIEQAIKSCHMKRTFR
jgi:hypothetical protein